MVPQADSNKNDSINLPFSSLIYKGGRCSFSWHYCYTYIGIFLGISCRRGWIVRFELSSNSQSNKSSKENSLTIKYLNVRLILNHLFWFSLLKYQISVYLHIELVKSWWPTDEKSLLALSIYSRSFSPWVCRGNWLVRYIIFFLLNNWL